jgi:hypothetical protein
MYLLVKVKNIAVDYIKHGKHERVKQAKSYVKG